MSNHEIRIRKTLRMLLLAAACTALPAFGSQAYVSLCCAAAGSVSSFSPQTNQLTGTFLTTPGAIDMVLSPDGAKAYVATTTSEFGGPANALAVYQLPAAKLIESTTLPVSPTEIVINTVGDHVYAVAIDRITGAHRVVSINLLNSHVAVAPLPPTNAFDLIPIAVSPDGTTLYTGSATQKTLTVLNASTLAQTGTIALTGHTGPASPKITPDGQYLCVVVSTGPGVHSALDIVNLATQNVTAVPIQTKAFPFGLALSLDGSTVYVNATQVLAVEVATGKVLGSANTHSQNPFRIALTPDGSALYATDTTDSVTSVVDTASLAVTGTLQTLANVFAISFTPQGQGYVLYQQGTSAVRVDTSAMKVVGRVDVGAGQSQVAVSPNRAEAFVLNAGSGNLSAISHPSTAVMATPLSVDLLTEAISFLGNNLYVLANGAVYSVETSPLQLSAPFTLPLPANSIANGAIASSPVAPYLFLPYVTLGDEGAIGAGLALYNTDTSSVPLIDSGLMESGPVTVSPDGIHVYTFAVEVNTGEPHLLDFDISTQTLARTVPLSSSYLSLAISRDGGTIYAVGSTGVDLISTSTLRVTASIAAGVTPYAIAINAAGTEALLTDSTSSLVTIIDLTTNQVAGTISVGVPSSGVAYLN